MFFLTLPNLHMAFWCIQVSNHPTITGTLWNFLNRYIKYIHYVSDNYEYGGGSSVDPTLLILGLFNLLETFCISSQEQCENTLLYITLSDVTKITSFRIRTTLKWNIVKVKK